MAAGMSSGYSSKSQLRPGQRARATGPTVGQTVTGDPMSYWTSQRMAAAQPYGMTIPATGGQQGAPAYMTGPAPAGPEYQNALAKLQRLAPNMTIPGMPTPNTQHVLNPPGVGMSGAPGAAAFAGGMSGAGGRTIAGYGGPHTYDPGSSYGFAGGSAPRVQVPTAPPVVPGPAMGAMPSQLAALLAMLSHGAPTGGTAPQIQSGPGPGLQSLNNGGYGMAPAVSGGLGQLNNGGYGMAPAVSGGLGQLNNGGYGMQPDSTQIQALLAMLGGGGSMAPLGSTMNAPGGPGPGRMYY